MTRESVESMPPPSTPASPASEQALLVTDRLIKEYRKRRVVNGVSIQVGPGEVVGLLGPNGAGKTTTFNMVVGVIRPDEGAVRFQGANITRLDRKSTRLNSSHSQISYAVFCLKKKKKKVEKLLMELI